MQLKPFPMAIHNNFLLQSLKNIHKENLSNFVIKNWQLEGEIASKGHLKTLHISPKGRP